MLPRFMPLAFLPLVLLTGAHAKPPTLDPTYGLPIPHLKAPPKSVGAAQWIWAAATQGDQIVNARGKVTLPAAPHSAKLYVTGDDSVKVFVNGRQVVATDSIELGWKQVRAISVGSLLHAGPNLIAAQGVNVGGGGAGILVRLDVDGKTVLGSGKDWRLLESANPPTNWTKAAFDDAHWRSASVVAAVGKGPWGTALTDWPDAGTSSWYLAHLPFRPKQFAAISGQFKGGPDLTKGGPITLLPSSTDSAPASLRIDFGQEIAGRLVLKGTAGASVRVTTGESIAELTHSEPALDNSGPYTLTLAGADSVTTPYSAFRYALLTFPSREAVTLTKIECDHKYYPVAYKGSFSCSDPLLTKIWYTGAYTAHLCMQEEIWDAPKRDRGLWGGDLHATGATINNVFADKFLMERSIRMLREEAQKGKPVSQLPVQDINMLPGYTASWFAELADFHRHIGDKAFLKSQHAGILTLLEFQKTQFNADHLFFNPSNAWDFTDWAPDFIQHTPHTLMATHLFDVQGVHEAVFLLRELGDNANADKYDAWAKTLTDAARRHFVDSATATYGNRLQTNAMAVYSGVATPEQKAAIYAKILKAASPVWKPPVHITSINDFAMTPYYGYYVLQDFGALGKPQDGLDLIRRYWGAMMARGATTTWEMFDPSLPADDARILDLIPYISLSHGWSTGPTSFLSEYILGVRPTSGGMKTVEITPFLGDLKWAEGDVPAPQGLIHVKATKKGAGQVVLLKLPAGIDAQVGVSGKTVSVNGRPAVISPRAGAITYVHLNKAGVYRLEGH
ncbi:MAG: alpha-L-rhamnosidase C-terminal domain-containing protein [Capsulimonas sp.]|uniref:alpha-L-rhamnosidase-related protein n=1 Tax=Capsulimonas sp. TaxID=2494211 RepID=UPI003262EDA1